MEGKGKAAIPCFFFFFFFFFFGFSLVVNAALLDFLAATRERERERERFGVVSCCYV
jgi:hypothetical protein